MAEKFLPRAEAPGYLREKFGEPAAVTAKTLQKMVTVGGGPVFYKFGSKVGYLPSDLDSWASARAIAHKSSSDVGIPASASEAPPNDILEAEDDCGSVEELKATPLTPRDGAA